LQPFVDEDQTYIHSWFPEQGLALGLPLLAGVIGLLAIGNITAFHGKYAYNATEIIMLST